MARPTANSIETLEVLITAQEAFPRFETLFLSAKHEIWAGFRVFDLTTRLRSDKAQQVGDTWFDLIRHTLERGVSISIALSDFDPVVATEYHEKSWRSVQQFTAAAEIAERGKLDFRVAPHPARVGILPRFIFNRKVREMRRSRNVSEYTPGLRKASSAGLHDLAPATHHQKMAVFDRRTVYLGGLDLDERRYDTLDHDQPAEETWQDVQVVVTGQVADAAQRHLETFEAVTARRQAPAPASEGFVRTLSSRRRFAPLHISPQTLVTEIEEAHVNAIARARHLIYLETQFFRHLPLAESLAKAGEQNPDLHVILVVPAAPEDVAFNENAGKDAQMGEYLQAEAVSRVRDAVGSRALICCPAQARTATSSDGRDAHAGAPIIYVHSKVSIFDDHEAIVSSANLNGRSLRWDTETGVHLKRPEHVRHLTRRIFTHWMPNCPVRDVVEAPVLAQDWQGELWANFRKRPKDRQSFLLPYDEIQARKFGDPVAVVPDELV